jgi:hypothetical protein
MNFLKRVWWDLTGRARQRLPDQMALLGASTELVASARSAKDEQQQEALFVRFVSERHACMLDWRATGYDVYEGLTPLLDAEERALVNAQANIDEDAPRAIAAISESLASSRRRVVQTESFGDFTFLILVPRDKEWEFVERVGPWRIPLSGNPR